MSVHDHQHDHDHGHSHKGHGGHHHHHHHHHHHSSTDNIKVALALNFTFALIEIAGGIWTQSVAILSDAVHDIGDTLALAFAYYFEKQARRKSDAQFSYGYRRLSLLSAVFTSVFLVCGSVGVLAMTIPRLINPVQPMVDGMLALALLGVAVNGYAAWRVQKGNTLNERAVSWHLIEDVLGWIAVLIVGVVMKFVDAPILDPILATVFTLFILWGVVRTLRETAKVFLQGVPAGVNLSKLRTDIERLEGVRGTHDAHLWSLDGESHVLTLHVVTDESVDIDQQETIKTKIREQVARAGRIHVTMEIEREGHECPQAECTPAY